MKIFVAGSTGRVGEKLLTELTATGHEVLAGARQPEKVKNPKVSPIKFDLTMTIDEMATIIAGVGVVMDVAGSSGGSLLQIDLFGATNLMQAAEKAVSMIRGGSADFLMKGGIQTSDLLKEVVNKERGLNRGRVMSHLGMFEIPGYHKLLALTDGGMVTRPDVNEKAQILMNAVETLHNLGYENPKVAVLAAAETVNPKIPESVDGDLLKKMNASGGLTGCIVEGPISYDLMISHEAAKIKGYESPVTGDTDILLMPDMTSGNLLAKAFQFTAGAMMAGMIVGAGAPIVLVSRGATAMEKYLSLVLSAASAKKHKA